MMQTVLLVLVLLACTAQAGDAKEPANPVPSSVDIQKQMSDLEGRVRELESGLKASETAVVLKGVDAHLQVIQDKLPGADKWSTWGSRLDGIASNLKATWSAGFWILVVVVAAGMSSLIASMLQRKQMADAVDTIASMARAVIEKKPTPIILAVEPQTGPTAGGTPIRVRGKNFEHGAALRFNGDVAANIVLRSSELLEAATPPGTAGRRDVSVQNRDGGMDTLAASFTYAPPPMVRGVIPETGSVGTMITVFGANFQDGAHVEISGVAIPTARHSENHLTCKVPEGTAGQAVEILVRNPDAQSSPWEHRFTYQK